MQLTVEQTYRASVEDVAAMLADVSFVHWRAERISGAGTVEQADVDADPAGGFTVMLRRTLPTTQIPAQARPFVGAHLEVRQAEVWEAARDGRRVGTVALEITGAPVRLTGTIALEPQPGGGTRQVYTGEVRATVPLFASVVEQAAVGTVRAALTAEEAAGREWLAGVR